MQEIKSLNTTMSGFFLFEIQLLQPANALAKPNHKACCPNNKQPVLQHEWLNIKHGATHSNNENLAHDNEQGDKHEAAAPLQMKSRINRFISSCIEQVPELHHHKGCEEQSALVGIYWVLGSL